MLYEIYQLKTSLNVVDDSDVDDELENLIHAQKLLNISEIRPPTPPKVLDDNKVMGKLLSYQKLKESEGKLISSGDKSVVLIDANPELLVTERDILTTLMEVNMDPKQAQQICKSLFHKSKETSLTQTVQVETEASYPSTLFTHSLNKMEANVNEHFKDESNISRKEDREVNSSTSNFLFKRDGTMQTQEHLASQKLLQDDYTEPICSAFSQMCQAHWADYMNEIVQTKRRYKSTRHAEAMEFQLPKMKFKIKERSAVDRKIPGKRKEPLDVGWTHELIPAHDRLARNKIKRISSTSQTLSPRTICGQRFVDRNKIKCSQMQSSVSTAQSRRGDREKLSANEHRVEDALEKTTRKIKKRIEISADKRINVIAQTTKTTQLRPAFRGLTKSSKLTIKDQNDKKRVSMCQDVSSKATISSDARNTNVDFSQERFNKKREESRVESSSVTYDDAGRKGRDEEIEGIKHEASRVSVETAKNDLEDRETKNKKKELRETRDDEVEEVQQLSVCENLSLGQETKRVKTKKCTQKKSEEIATKGSIESNEMETDVSEPNEYNESFTDDISISTDNEVNDVDEEEEDASEKIDT